MPLGLKFVLGFVYVQVVINALFGVLIQVEISEAAEHGQELAHATLVYFAEYLSFATAVALLVGAVVVTRGVEWGRIVLVIVEAIAIVSGVITLFNGSPQAVIGLVLAGLVIKTLLEDNVKAWLDGKAYSRRVRA